MAYDITITITDNADAVRIRDAFVGLYGPVEEGENAADLFEGKLRGYIAEQVGRWEGDQAAKAARVAAIDDIENNVGIEVPSDTSATP